jgi:S-DNA-T family DNA segregation ATPase FtsK/SpoIIIE
VVGAPQAGKSGTVCTIVTGPGTRHDPRRIQWYCLDFGGGALHTLGGLPHVGSVAGRHDRDLVHRIVGHVTSVLRARERLTRDDGYGDVFLVIDGWAVVREDFAELEPAITAIAAQGLSHGVHLLVTAGRWADIRPGLRDQFGTRIELRLGDPLDSEMDRKQAALVPPTGRAAGSPATAPLRRRTIASRSRDGRPNLDRPPVRLLPDTIDHDERCCFKPVATRRS